MGSRRKSEMSELHKITISESIDVNISSGLCVGEFQNVVKTSSPYLLHRSYVVSYMFSQVRITLDTHNTGTQSDLKNFQELTEIWISSHSENVRGVRARSARTLVTSLKYHCITHSCHCTLKNYEYPPYYSLLSSNVTKYLTRASRSNTGTRCGR